MNQIKAKRITFAACSGEGIRSYSVDGSGNLTFVDEDDRGESYYGVGAGSSYIFITNGDGGLLSYEVSK